MPAIAAFSLSVAMLAAFLLAYAGIRQCMKKEDRVARQRGLLMLTMAIVLVANVLIWTV